jgi:outer membrane protein assembly factor BamD
MRTFAVTMLVLGVLGCGGGAPETQPAPQAALRATAEQLDTLVTNARALLDEGEWNDAAIAYERLLLEMPRGDRRLPATRIALGDARMGQKSYLQAVREYRRTADEYPTDSLAPTGLLKAGDAYAKLWRRPELDPTYGTQAMATWQELLTRYGDSPVAATARQRIAGLEEWFALKSFKAADFYLRYKAYDSAILYLKDLVARYPRTTLAPRALERLVSAYRRLGYQEDVQEMCTYFRNNHPDAPQLAVSCPLPTAAPSAAVPGG